jgi:hypothetical protein
MSFDDRGDDGSSGRATTHRRQFLRGISAAGIAGVVAGCLGGGDDDTPTPTTESGNGNGNGDDDDTTPTESTAFTIRSVDPSEASAHRPNPIEITATIENGGSASAEETVELSVDSTVLASTDLSLDGGQVEDISLDVNTEELDPGEYEFTVATAEDDASGTLTAEPFLDPPRNLLSFDAEQPLQLSIGSNTITGVLDNPYLSAIESVETTLVVPDGWEADPGTVSVDSIEPRVPTSVEWEVSVPESAVEEHQLTVELSYSALGETAELSTDLSVTVSLPVSIPFGMDCGGTHTDEAVEIDGLAYQPAADVAQGVTLRTQPFGEEGETLYQGRQLTDEEVWWPDGVSTSPVPEEFPGALSDVRPLAVEEDRGTAPDVANTPHDPLYWTEQYGTDLAYEFSVPNGTYDVTVHLAEVWWAGEGQRVFDLSVGGETVAEGLDLYAEHGPDTAVQFTTEVEVSGSTLTVSTTSQEGPAKIAGIEIREAGNAPAFDGGESFDPTPADNRAVYNFEQPPSEDDAWTVEQDDLGPRDISYGSYNSVGIEADTTGEGPLATAEIPDGDGPVESISVFLRETESSTGHGVQIINGSGSMEVGFALDNPQWFAVDADSGPVGSKLWDPQDDSFPPDEEIPWDQFYQQWVYVRLDFDWEAGTCDLNIRNLEAPVDDPAVVTYQGTRNLLEGEGAAEIHLSNYNIGGGQGFVATDACYAWFDDIRVK